MKVLVIDDEPLVRRSLLRALRSAGFETIEAENGKEGLELWIKEKPSLVFLDILMPGLSGPQVLAQLDNNIKKMTKVVLMSAYTGQYNLETALQLGAHEFISKPFDDIFLIVKKAQEMLGNG